MVCTRLAKLIRMKRFKHEVEEKNPRITPSREKTFFMENSENEFFQKTNQILVKHVKRIGLLLTEEFGQVEEKRWHEEKELKYKFAAIVMDRFFFYLANIYFLITFSSLILAIPNFYKFS